MTEVPAHLLARAKALKAQEDAPVPLVPLEQLKSIADPAYAMKIERKLKRSVRKHLVKEWLLKKGPPVHCAGGILPGSVGWCGLAQCLFHPGRQSHGGNLCHCGLPNVGFLRWLYCSQ